jgi:hypothetical protein
MIVSLSPAQTGALKNEQTIKRIVIGMITKTVRLTNLIGFMLPPSEDPAETIVYLPF